MNGVELTLYHLTELQDAETIFVCEGEKDADNLKAAGSLTTTTLPGGTKKWKDDYGKYLTGKAVVILPDNDDLGRTHAQIIAANAKQNGAVSIKVLDLGVEKEAATSRIGSRPSTPPTSCWPSLIIRGSGSPRPASPRRLSLPRRPSPSWTRPCLRP